MIIYDITVEDVLRWEPCGNWTEARIRRIAKGKESWTIPDILDLPGVDHLDLMWLILRPQLIPEHMLHKLACSFAEHVLPFYEQRYPEDTLLHEALRIKRAWIVDQSLEYRRRLQDLRDQIMLLDRDMPWSDVVNAVWYATLTLPRSAARSASRFAILAIEHIISEGNIYEEKWQQERITYLHLS